MFILSKPPVMRTSFLPSFLPSFLFIVIFSLFILFDLKRVVDGGETNYVTATLGIYISVYNVFSNLLAMLGIFGGSDD